MAVYTKKWNGSAWVTAPFKKWNGSSWVDAYVWKWNGSKWVQLYPDTVVSGSTNTVTSGTMNNYKSKNSAWKNDSTARQGNGSTWGGSPANWGYMNISAWSYAGAGNIVSVSSASFSGTRGGSGYYNNTQTVKFYRSAIAPSSVPTTSNIAGNFNCTFAMPGSGKAFSGKGIETGTNFLNWLNAANSQPYLYIYSNVAADYASFTGTCKVSATYDYSAATALFVDEVSASSVIRATDDYNSIKNTAYHTMPIYKDEIGMPLNEIMQRREDGLVQDIDSTNVDRLAHPKPWTKNYTVEADDEGNLRAKIEVFSLGMDDEVQISMDKNKWSTMMQTDATSDYVECILPKDYNKVTDWCYIRVINKKTDELYLTVDIEPMILLP